VTLKSDVEFYRVLIQSFPECESFDDMFKALWHLMCLCYREEYWRSTSDTWGEFIELMIDELTQLNGLSDSVAVSSAYMLREMSAICVARNGRD
jgi:hypothetical protein